VNILEVVAPIMLNTFYVVIAFFIAKYAFVSYFFAVHKTEITALSSQISSLKLKLRTRISHKFSNVGSFGNPEITAAISPIVDDLKDLDFHNPEDYQQLITKMLQIIDRIKTEELLLSKSSENLTTVDTSFDSIAPELDILKKTYTELFNFDKGIIAIVIEVSKLHADYIKVLRDYNKYADLEKNQKSSEKIPDPILIENFYILEDIYQKYKKEVKDALSLSSEADTRSRQSADTKIDKKAG
jgi:hypothetical protein